MSDKLVFDLASEVEGSPNVFIRKDWINILDNQNQNYNNNQSVLDTSQLSNSNKYMSYREAYFLMPLLLTLGQTTLPVITQGNVNGGQPGAPVYLTPATFPSTKSMDYSIGLKNWFGQMIHSFTLDYNGTTIIQQTPFVNMWNSFKLLTSLSYGDIITQGSTIGFYPDDASAFQYQLTVPPALPVGAAAPASLVGQGTCNNANFRSFAQVGGAIPSQQPALNFNSSNGNDGFIKRQYVTNFDGAGVIGAGSYQYSSLLASGAPGGAGGQGGASSYCNAIWKSYINKKQDQSATVGALIQCSITAIVYLKHVHSFFNMCPLLKGVFMKMTMNLNNCSTTFSANSVMTAGALASSVTPSSLICTGVQNSIGGVNPIMIASAGFVTSTVDGASNVSGYNGSSVLLPAYNAGLANLNAGISTIYTANISVGAICLNQPLKSAGAAEGELARSVYLYIPAYTFNPVFEQSYLSSPIKQIKYTDIYQYQVLNIPGGGTGQFNNLLTNGIANIKSVLLIPFYSTGSSTSGTTIVGSNIPNATAAPFYVGNATVSNNTGFLNGVPVWQSPFDPAGCGCTSPLISFSNMNVQISGQNAIYNVQKYAFEEFNNQLYGQNAVNGGMTDGLTSCLIDRFGFDMEYCYYYVNVERMLPVEQSVPKSVQILGTNNSNRAVDLYCFIEYGNDISIDALTGARV